MVGTPGETVRVKVWLVEIPFEAVIVNVNCPLAVIGGVPVSAPLVASIEIHDGAPLIAKADAGVPLAVTVKAPATPAWNVAFAALVMLGAVPIVSVAASEVAGCPMPLVMMT